MNDKTITLSNGARVRVVAVPPYAVIAAQSAIALPAPPTIEIKSVAGHTETVPDTNPESPAYQAYQFALAEAQRRRAEAANYITLLLGLPDVVPPADDAWFAPLTFVGVQPREGEQGRKLDYILYRLLITDADIRAVFDAIAELTYTREERIASIEDSFRGDSGRAAAQTVPIGR